MENPLVRINGLNGYTVEELEDRAHELWLHHRQFEIPGYFEKYVRGEIPDPMEGYRPGDPWYSLSAINEHLKGRMT
jgi:hypothetical protein